MFIYDIYNTFVVIYCDSPIYLLEDVFIFSSSVSQSADTTLLYYYFTQEKKATDNQGLTSSTLCDSRLHGNGINAFS